MVRTQIQLPDELHRQLREIAKAKEWTMAELIRRGAEYAVCVYGHAVSTKKDWTPPRPRKLGGFRRPPEEWRELANARDVPEMRRK